MKKSCFFILIFLAHHAFAQTESFYSQPYFSTEIVKAIQTKDKNTWYIGVTNGLGNASYGKTFLFIGVLDSLLRPIKTFTKDLPQAERMSNIIFKPLADSTFLVGFNSNLCDVAFNNGILGIYSINDESYFPIFETNSDINNMFSLPNGTPAAYSAKGKSLMWYDSNQMEEKLVPIPLEANDKVNSIFASEERIYYTTDKNIFYSIDFEGKNKKKLGAAPDTGIYGTLFSEEIEKDKKIIIATYNTLYYIDFQANTVKNYSFGNSTITALHFFKDSKKIYVAGRLGNVTIFDENFKVEKEIPFSIENMNKANHFFTYKNKMYIAGATNYMPSAKLQKPDYFETRNVSTIRPLDSITFTTKVAIINAQVENPLPIQNVKNWGSTLLYDFDFGNTSLTIQNTGKDTIQSINVGFNHAQYAYICDSEIANKWRVDNLNLAPNKKTIISLGTLFLNNQRAQDFSSSLLFNVALVNDKPNSEPNKGFFQVNYTITATNDKNLVNNVQIYPNPATQVIHINSPEEYIQQVDIFDLMGKNILSQNIDNQQFTTISIENLPHGFYKILIKKEKTVTTAKLIVQGER